MREMRPLLENNRELQVTHCVGKYFYHTYEFAKEQAERYQKRFNAPTQRAYKCEYCPYYHVGRTDKMYERIKNE